MTDFALNRSKVLFGIFGAHTLRRVDVQSHLPGVNVGEKIVANEECQGEGQHDE
jgi:hypothetical protein